MFGGTIADGRLLIDQIAICIMLDHEARDIPPVVEDLGAEDVAADAPDGVVLLLGEPLVAQQLGVEVVDLEAGVVHVLGLAAGHGRGHEEGVVVDGRQAAVDAAEQRDFLAGRRARGAVDLGKRHVQDVRRVDVEVACVPVHLGWEVVDVEAEVAKLR